MRRSLFKVLCIVWTVFVVSIVVFTATWYVRGNQYREYAVQRLKDTVLGNIVYIHAQLKEALDNDTQPQWSQLSAICYKIDAIKQEFRNLYLRSTPGSVSTGPSAWSHWGDYFNNFERQENRKIEAKVYTNLIELLEKYIAIFEPTQSLNSFEINLSSFELEMNVLLR